MTSYPGTDRTTCGCFSFFFVVIVVVVIVAAAAATAAAAAAVVVAAVVVDVVVWVRSVFLWPRLIRFSTRSRLKSKSQ